MYKILSLFFVFFCIVDLVTTLILMFLCDHNIEGNPFAFWVYDNFGYMGMILLKVFVCFFVLLISRFIHRRSFYSYFILYFGCLLYCVASMYTVMLIHIFF